MQLSLVPRPERRHAHPVEEVWRVHFAENDDDFAEALRLVQSRYEMRGYVPEGRERAELTLYHVLPETRTILVKALSRVVATVTFVPDSPLGLPAEQVFHDEVAPLRAEGRHLSELSALAVADRIRIEDRPHLTRWLFHSIEAQVRGEGRIDDLLITVNPRHVAFYDRRLGFETIAGPRPHPKVQGADAVLMRLRADLDRSHLTWWERAKEESQGLIATLLANDPGWIWDDSRLTQWADALRLVASEVSRTGCDYLRHLFPAFPWPEECGAQGA